MMGVLSQEHPSLLQAMKTEAAHALLKPCSWKCHNQRRKGNLLEK
jgi:hypothetical protein